ncbi:MAG: tetratricopeptide repeat protein [bacterium]|nr:tetratricopeptide repeat protein [bacterium]
MSDIRPKESKIMKIIGPLWIAGSVLMFIRPAVAVPFIGVTGLVYFIYQFAPSQRAQKILKKALKVFRKGDYAVAVILLKKAKEIDPKYIYIDYLSGASYHNLERYKDAIPFLERYEEHGQKNYDNRLILANCYYKTRKYSKAVKLLGSIPEDFDRYLRSTILYGNSLYGMKKYSEALAVFEKGKNAKESFKGETMELEAAIRKTGKKLSS